MSQASKALKEIAAGAEYAALAQAVAKSDYEAISTAYRQLNNIIEEKKKQILEKIDGLTRQNKVEDRQQFLNAFSGRLSSTLPAWQKLTNLLQELKVTQGEVVGQGAKGDPMVRADSGRLAIVPGGTVEKGSRVLFRVTREGVKVDFGQIVELNTDFFYFLLNQGALVEIQSRFNALENKLKLVASEITDELLNDLLQELEKVRPLAEGLRPGEKENVYTRILGLRKRLLGEYGVRMAIEYLAKQEAAELRAMFPGDEAKIAVVLAAPGLFRHREHQALKTEVFAGKELKGYNEALQQLESNLDSMDAAMKLMEFKSGIDDVADAAKDYLAKMDNLFEKLYRKARAVVYGMAEDKIATVAEIQQHIEAAFVDRGAAAEMRGVFRNLGEFFALRESLARLRTMLGSKTAAAGETAIRPYLSQKVSMAFAREQVLL